MLGYLFVDIICSDKKTVFRELSSRKSVSSEEQNMPNARTNIRTYYPTALRRVQITLKTSTNITRCLYFDSPYGLAKIRHNS